MEPVAGIVENDGVNAKGEKPEKRRRSIAGIYRDACVGIVTESHCPVGGVITAIAAVSIAVRRRCYKTSEYLRMIGDS